MKVPVLWETFQSRGVLFGNIFTSRVEKSYHGAGCIHLTGIKGKVRYQETVVSWVVLYKKYTYSVLINGAVWSMRFPCSREDRRSRHTVTEKCGSLDKGHTTRCQKHSISADKQSSLETAHLPAGDNRFPVGTGRNFCSLGPTWAKPVSSKCLIITRPARENLALVK